MSTKKAYKDTLKSVLVDDIEQKIRDSKLTPPVVGTASQIMGLTGVQPPPQISTESLAPASDREDDAIGVDDRNLINKDALEVRKNLKNLFKKGSEAVDRVVKTINEESYPKTVETLSDLIKTLVTVNKEIMNTHEVKHRILNPEGLGPNPPAGEAKPEEKVTISSADLNKMVEEAIGKNTPSSEDESI